MYYFDINRDNHAQVYHVEEVYNSLAMAHADAVGALSDMVKDEQFDEGTGELEIRVRDADGYHLLTVTLSLKTEFGLPSRSSISP
jgi:hypothetical protein